MLAAQPSPVARCLLRTLVCGALSTTLDTLLVKLLLRRRSPAHMWFIMVTYRLHLKILRWPIHVVSIRSGIHIDSLIGSITSTWIIHCMNTWAGAYTCTPTGIPTGIHKGSHTGTLPGTITSALTGTLIDTSISPCIGALTGTFVESAQQISIYASLVLQIRCLSVSENLSNVYSGRSPFHLLVSETT